ncbi:hypothetical protein AVEN_105083-1 [Araneus ventricosus]|uniref:Uncharacterized protein n=1 Tax=Araneus ventricosus TaxID=182803 RepID=A0A4Y2GRK9_ARAVE|nr:hypothetical protein AVEN_105083-1 [Araneus ventricosus]
MFRADRPAGAETWFWAVSLELVFLPQRKGSEGIWGFFRRECCRVVCLYRSGDNGCDLPKLSWDAVFKFWDVSKMLIICNRAEFE